MKKVTTPAGKLEWVYITGNGREDLNGVPKFSADISMPREQAQPLLNELDELWESEKPKDARQAKSMGYKELMNGDIKFSFKTAITYPKSGDKKKIAIYDAKAKPVEWPDDKRIGNGSIGKIAGAACVYDAGKAARGVTLYLDAVQLLKLVEYQGGGAAFAPDDSGDFEADGPGFDAVDLV